MTAIEQIGIVLLIVLIIAGGVGLLWWLLIATEGVYLGRRVVIWLYDVYARRYDNIKQYDEEWEAETLGVPILQTLWDVPAPLVLDVATGTARLPLALLNQSAFQGSIIGLDYSRQMLSIAAEKLDQAGRRWSLIYQPAQALPFDADTFDIVTCLEALEFMPDPNAVITELVRVVRPGGLILITNRKGFDARLMPGKTQSVMAIMATLRERFKLQNVRAMQWQMDYQLIWAFKPGLRTPAPDHALEVVLRCPKCGRHTLSCDGQTLHCESCGARIPIGADGVIEYAAA